jgi:hypothetical protein
LNVTTSTLTTVENAKFNMSVYPVPASSELNIELDNIDDYDISLYNSIGQTIKATTISRELNKVILNTASLSDGLYFVDFTKGPIKDTRKIIIRH